MKNIKWCITLLMLITVFTAWISASYADDGPLSEFMAEVSRAQNQTSFLSRWTEGDKQRLASLMEKYNLGSEQSGNGFPVEWLSAPIPLAKAFQASWGDQVFWSLEQNNCWSEWLVQLGLEKRVYHRIPTDGEMSLNEAKSIARATILEHAQYHHYKTDNLDEYRISTRYILYEERNAPIYLIDYYLPDGSKTIFSVTIEQNGVASLSYKDPKSISAVYREWYYNLGMIRFAYWSLQDKADFYKSVSGMYEAEMSASQDLSDIAQQVLAHVHSIPHGDELQEADAVAIANNALAGQGVHSLSLQEFKLAVFFYRDDPQNPIYEVKYYKADELRYTVTVDASSGTYTIR